MKQFLGILLLIIITFQSEAVDRRGRLGVGFTNQLKVNVPAISFKLQRSRSFAFGGAVGLNTDDKDGGMAAGLKFYKNLFDEPQLNFYAAGYGGILKEKKNSISKSGMQFDLTLGSEFNFAGLQSLAFNVEFGISFNKVDDFVIETVGHNFIIAGVHFYL